LVYSSKLSEEEDAQDTHRLRLDRWVFAVIETKHFADWHDFADWMKQRHLRGMAIAVYNWEYVDS